LHILGTLDKPTEGKVVICGQDPFALKNKDISKFRAQTMGFVFQNYNLLPEFTALENVLAPAYILGIGNFKKSKEAHDRAHFLLNRVGLQNRSHHFPSQLSGGEQQRVAIARALMNEPKILLADEPTGNLDSKKAYEIHQLLYDLNKETGMTMIIVTHNQELASMASRIVTLSDGSIVGDTKQGSGII
jgi:lipoprotein-releasing system ATP-binding protein